ncbi:MAG: non-canonical purine NTP pyrophosphatase [Candidatus Dojkabacteria bacterium]|jgi:XTP/dITP diphosphohydrolase
MILYVTSNENKILTANRLLEPFGIKVKKIQIEGIVEPQTEDIEELSQFKAQQAFKKIQKPLLVSDGFWIIPALNGFPGPYMAYINKWFCSQDFLNLMKEKDNKEIILRECVTYIDKEHIKTFTSDTKGFFVEKASGKATPVDQVISFREDGKTTAECENKGLPRIPQNDLWNMVGQWLEENSLK